MYPVSALTRCDIYHTHGVHLPNECHMHLVNALNLVMVHLQFANTIEANILLATGQVANATTTRVETGSIGVWNTIAFTGGDSAAATAARDSVFSALSSTNLANYFGSSFGDVTVSSVQSTNSTNPSKCCSMAILALSLA
ncbi:hypothetical protein ABBQ32_000936 [Trebouxia sp. C0010 RCD-2024]